MPNGASLQRTSEAARKVENIILHTPGVQGCTSVIGFSLFSRVQSTYNAFFFVTEKPWDERKAAGTSNILPSAITSRAACSRCRTELHSHFRRPSIPGVGTSGGVTFMLEDRSGADLSFLTGNVNKFMQAARAKGAGWASVPLICPSVPQDFADVDRAKGRAAGGQHRRRLSNFADVSWAVTW